MKGPQLFGVEKLLGGAFVCLLGLWIWTAVPPRQPFELYVTRVVGGGAWYGLGVLLAGFALRVSDLQKRPQAHLRETLERFCFSYLKPSRLFLDLRLVHAAGVTFFLFIQFKHLTPSIRTVTYDQWLLMSERWVFGGRLLSERMVDFLGAGPAEFLSLCYTAFFPYLGLFLAILLLQRDIEFAQRTLLGFAFLWLLGILLIYMLPSLGPCFFVSESFSHLPPTETSKLISDLWKGREFVMKNPFSERGIFLISGFPSLHVAIVAYGSLVLGPRFRILAYLSWVFLALTVVSTLYFGWHYVLDDIGGFVMAAFAYSFFVTGKKRERL